MKNFLVAVGLAGVDILFKNEKVIVGHEYINKHSTRASLPNEHSIDIHNDVVSGALGAYLKRAKFMTYNCLLYTSPSPRD